MKKTIFTTLCLLLLCLFLLPGKAEAATVVDSGSCGENLIWTLDSEGTLTISGTGPMDEYIFSVTDGWGDVEIPSPWWSNADIRTVVIENGITTVGGWSFWGCTGITSVSIPGSVTAIGNSAFLECSGLQSISIPYGVTQIGYEAFYDCTGLEEIFVADSVTGIMDDAFKNTAWFDGQPDGVVYAGKVAYEYKGTNAEDVILRADTVGIAEDAFSSRKLITSISIPEGVKIIGNHAFNWCTGLEKITFHGDMPEIGRSAFNQVTATAYYPVGNTTWTGIDGNNYGIGTLTWCAYTPHTAEKFDVYYTRMVLGNSLDMQFGVRVSGYPEWSGAYAVVQKGSATSIIPATEWAKISIDGEPHWAITYADVAAKEMSDDITLTVYNAYDEAVTNPCTESVRGYAMRKLGETDNSEFKTMLVDMLHYGAAVQQNFNYNTGDLADALLTAEQLSWGSDAKTVTNSQVKGDFYQGTRLILESRIQMQVSFSGIAHGMYAVYSYTDHLGEEHSVTVPFADMIQISGETYAIELDQLVVADARQLVTVVVYTADGQFHGGVVDSIESYCKRSSLFMPLSLALMQFSDSAYAYFH